MSVSHGGAQVIAVTIAFTLLALTATALRIWSRQIMGLRLAFNDYASITAMILAIGVAIIALYQSFSLDVGFHLLDVPPEKLGPFFKTFVAGQILWASANTSVKFSILSLYVHIFPSRSFAIMCYIVMGMTSIYWIAVFFEAFFLCKPVQYSWDKTIPGGHCTNENEAYLSAGIINFIIDIIVVVLPMPMLFQLQMPLSKKIGVASMFGLGALICIITLQRVLWLQNWDLTDLTFTVVPGSIWSFLEPSLGVVNACLPTMRPALNKMFNTKHLQWTKYSQGYSSQNSRTTPKRRDKSSPGNVSSQQNFQRLSDADIPLTNIEHDPVGKPVSPRDDGRIRVTHDWKVESSV